MVISNEKISVIIPVYKAENTIERCLDSVIGQSYENLEIILVDDGSPDKSGEICDQYARRDSRIRVVHQKNKGLSGARNAGLAIMSGAFFFFLDSDDYIADSAIELLYERAHRDQADLVIGNVITINDLHEAVKNPVFEAEHITETHFADTGFRFAYFYSPGFGNSVWNKLYRTAFFRKTGLLFDERLRIAEDYPFNLFFFSNSPKIKLVNEYTYFYCHYASTITKSKTDRLIESLMIIQDLQYRFFEEVEELEKYADIIQFSLFGSIHQICHQAYRYSKNPFRDAKRYIKKFIESPIPKQFVTSIARGDYIRNVPRRAWRWYARMIGLGLRVRFYWAVVLIHFIRFQL